MQRINYFFKKVLTFFLFKKNTYVKVYYSIIEYKVSKIMLSEVYIVKIQLSIHFFI